MRNAIQDRPLAAHELTSYRYKGRYGYIMIGANDHADAMREAARSTDAPLSRDNLEVWNGKTYTPAKGRQ